MQTPFTQPTADKFSKAVFEVASSVAEASDIEDSHPQDKARPQNTPFLFTGGYVGQMEMASDRATVSTYLDNHRDWFVRCAHPMTADPLGQNGYALTIGKFGALGYEVEPRIGLNLLPQEQGVYRIETIPVPGYESPGYEVDFKAALELKEQDDAAHQPLTQVNWELDLQVSVQFPRFIHALPQGLIQKTGDHLLSQIVRQVSRRLTHKVQEDFHQSLNLPFPESYRQRSHHFLERFSQRG